MAGSASGLCPMLAPLTDVDSLRMSTSHQQQSFVHRLLWNTVYWHVLQRRPGALVT
jgi:hypothetical protein